MKLIKTDLLRKHNHNSAAGVATASYIDFCKWQFRCSRLKLLKLLIQGEFDTAKRNKYIREYNSLKELLRGKIDMSDFPSYEIK